MQTATQLKQIVKEKYGSIAKRANTSCCSSSCCSSSQPASPLSQAYSQLEGYDTSADLNLGCGIPTQFVQIKEGDVVLDLGSGAGNDVFVARALVGESGKVIGVDMTADMIARAQQNQARLGYQNVEFRLGEIEALPVNDREVNVVVSNCVINLVPNKQEAFQEIYRVLKPGGRFCISDIVLHGDLPEKLKSAAEMYAGCIAGASQQEEYLRIIRETGFVDVEIKTEHSIRLSDNLLAQYLSQDELQAYRRSNNGMASITVFGRKPDKVL